MTVANSLGAWFARAAGGPSLKTLSRPALVSLVFLGTATGCGLLANGLLARLLGAESFGIYTYAIAVLEYLSVPYAGASQVVMRSFARYRVENAYELMRGLHVSGRLWVLGSATAIGAAAAVVAWLLAGGSVTDRVTTQWVAFAVLPAMAMLTFSVASIQGLGHVVAGQWPDQIVRPGMLLLLALTGWLVFNRGEIDAWQAMIMLLIAVGCAAVLAVMIAGAIQPALSRHVPGRFEPLEWGRAILPFLVIGGLQQVNAQIDVLMLGGLRGMEDVGLYRPAVLLAALITFGQAAVNVPLRPTLAALHSAGDRRQLQDLITMSARLSLLFALPVGLILIAFGSFALSVLFGAEYSTAWGVLAILCIGKIINTAMGPVVITLNMTGNENFTLKGLSVAAITNMVLCALLIRSWGIYGAAVATCVSEIVWNSVLAFGVFKRVGVISTPIKISSLQPGGEDKR